MKKSIKVLEGSSQGPDRNLVSNAAVGVTWRCHLEKVRVLKVNQLQFEPTSLVAWISALSLDAFMQLNRTTRTRQDSTHPRTFSTNTHSYHPGVSWLKPPMATLRMTREPPGPSPHDAGPSFRISSLYQVSNSGGGLPDCVRDLLRMRFLLLFLFFAAGNRHRWAQK